MAVFALDKRKNPLMPTSEKRARLLLEKGRAVVIKMYPFTIRLKDRVGGELQQVQIKIDPGSKYTGVSVVRNEKVLNLFQINHRGSVISANLTSRRQMRRRRRSNFNRGRLSIPKTHALDAACVGEIDFLTNWNIPTLEITCCGRESYQRTRLDKYGFPRGNLTRQKSIKGFQTGDLVKATVTKGKKIGVYTGRVAVRASENFNISTAEGSIQGINHRYCTLISRNDGYDYKVQPSVSEKIIRPIYKMEKAVH